MLYLALSILFSSLIFVIFKLYIRFNVETPYAIITNYVVACAVGLVAYTGSFDFVEITQKSWFLGALALGVLFILIFNIMALTSQRLGVSVASVATKMSFVVPAVVGIFLYKEELGPLKVLGILIAIMAVYLSSIKKTALPFKLSLLFLPFLVFLGSGIIDTSIKYFQELHLKDGELPLFSATVFFAAGISGFVFMGFKAIKQRVRFNIINVIGGIALGVPNYFSIYFLVKALEYDGLNSASIFTINNVAIVLLSTLFGIIFFKERLSLKNWSGIGLAILSILLVSIT
ncbi:DMT family transporter [Maribacter aestuarii]|uniref:DMT family transporter n=1 Tax=Maribacter aestuarii TaxID=1130723 RepID=UPI00248BEA4A|nr:DMT family transporter [Maribacter aestuarii]